MKTPIIYEVIHRFMLGKHESSDTYYVRCKHKPSANEVKLACKIEDDDLIGIDITKYTAPFDIIDIGIDLI